MIDLIPYILILLTISALAMYFIVRVLIQQVRLYKYPISDRNVSHFRNVLLFISITIIIMGMIPIVINTLILLNIDDAALAVPPSRFVYSVGVQLQTLFLSYLLWRIYRLAKGDFNDKDK
jgi:hypothetical protein